MTEAHASHADKSVLGSPPVRYSTGRFGPRSAGGLIVIGGVLIVMAGIVLRLDLIKPRIGTTGQFREIRLISGSADGTIDVLRDDGLHAKWHSGERIRVVRKGTLATWLIERISDGRTAEVSEHFMIGVMTCRRCRAEMQVLASGWGNPITCSSCRTQTMASLPKP